MAEASPVSGYQHDDAWDKNWLRVDDTHEIYYEQYGPKDGKPAIYLHGGPGGHISKANTQFFDPSVYRVVLLDQRGAGASRPNACTTDNTTWHLVADLEALRTHLGISKWHLVFGGSWGSTLALAYAQTHPASVGSLVLRGIFCVRRSELDWTMRAGGAAQLFPDAFDRFVEFLPEHEREQHIEAYHVRLMSEDTAVSHPAAAAWNAYEINMSTLRPNVAGMASLEDPAYLLAHARVEAHYFRHGAWLEEGQLLRKENVEKMRSIPGAIVQGRYDVVCPPTTAWELHKAWPEAELHWIDDAGHSATEPGTKKKLIEVVERFGKLEIQGS